MSVLLSALATPGLADSSYQQSGSDEIAETSAWDEPLSSESVTVRGSSGRASISVTPHPGQTVTALTAELSTNQGSGSIVVDVFVEGTLTDSIVVNSSAEPGTSELVTVRQSIRLELGSIDDASIAELQVRRIDFLECADHEDDLVQLDQIATIADGEIVSPNSARDFFPTWLSKVSIVVGETDQLTESTSDAVFDVVAILSSYYRNSNTVIQVVSDVPPAIGDLERSIIFDTVSSASEPNDGEPAYRWEPDEPRTLRLEAATALGQIADLLDQELPRFDPGAMVYNDQSEYNATGQTTAEVWIPVSQSHFGRIPGSYQVTLSGWNAMPSSDEFGNQTLTIQSNGRILHTQTLTEGKNWEATFEVDEPPRDLTMSVLLRGPKLGGQCGLEQTPLQVGVNNVRVEATGNGPVEGFESYPQHFGQGYKVDVSSEGVGYAAELISLLHEVAPVPMTNDGDDLTLSIELVESDPNELAVLTADKSGIRISGTGPAIEALLEQVEDESWFALRGAEATLGSDGLAMSGDEAGFGLAMVDDEQSDDVVDEAQTGDDLEAEEQTALPPISGDEPGSDSEQSSAGGIPVSIAVGAIFFLLAAGVLFSQRNVLLGRR